MGSKVRPFQTGATGMSESDVRVIVNDAFALYEKDTGKPRHDENTVKLTAIERAFDRVRGALWAVGLLFGVPGCIASILVIVSKVRGH